MNKKILITRQYPLSGIKLLEQENFELTRWEKERPMTALELMESAAGHHALLCTLTDKIDAQFLSLNRQIEMISQFAVGYDNIDVALATQMGIPVGYTPDVLSEATADLAFGLMIAVARKMFFLHKSILKGKWGHFNPVGSLGMELKNKTLGVFGLGRIGMKMAQRCKAAYGMKVIYFNRTPNLEAENHLDAVRVDFKDLLSLSDILSVHAAFTPETKEVFNLTTFNQMKPSAIFINTARGGIHQEEDLRAALENKIIWGAGLDVTNPEPMQPDNPLLEMENVCILPHVGSGTQEARSAMSVLAANNLIEFFKSGRVPNIVNPEVLKAQGNHI